MENLKEVTTITKRVRAYEAQEKRNYKKIEQIDAFSGDIAAGRIKNGNSSESHNRDFPVKGLACGAGQKQPSEGKIKTKCQNKASKNSAIGSNLDASKTSGSTFDGSKASGSTLNYGALVELEKSVNHVGIKDLPAEERPRERLFRYGAEKLTNAELIALVIGSGSNEGSALAVAERLLCLDQTGLTHLAECLPEELFEVKGIGKSKAAKLAAAIELGRRLSVKPPDERYCVRSSADVAELVMNEMRYLKKESFRVLLLNVKNEVLSIDNTAIGGLNSANIHPREVFTSAVKKSASTIVLVHNHPSGNPEPSQSDILLTKRLIEAGRIMGINVADHVVIGNGCYKSIFAGYLD